MKKKIALLLAVIMTLSLMPMTVFAGSSNYLAKGTQALKKDTKYDGTTNAIQNSLVIEFKDAIPLGSVQKIRLELANAEFSNLTTTAMGDTVSKFVADAKSYAIASPGAILASATWSVTGILSSPVNATTGMLMDFDANYGGTIDASGVVEGLPNVATITITQAPRNSKLIIPLPIKTDNVSDADVSVAITANNSYVSEGTFLLSKTANGTTVTMAKSIKSGRDLLALENIVIKETLVGALKNINTAGVGFELVAPSGYDFVNTSAIAINGTGQFSGIVASKTFPETDIMRVTLTGGVVSTIIPESIVISGVQIEPSDDDSIPFGTELSMNVYRYNGLDGLNEQTFAVAKPVDWTISLTAETAKDVVTGRYDSRIDANGQVAAKVTFKELVTGAWIAERTTEFVVPEGVTIRGAKFDSDGWKNILQNYPSNINTGGNSAGPQVDKDKWSTTLTPVVSTDRTGTIIVDKNVLSFKNMSVTPTKKGEMSFTLYLSVSPEYKKDTITLTAAGTSVLDEKTPEVVIANVMQPIKVSVSKVADVQIGFQRYAVGDITIEETKAGAILRNADVNFQNAVLGDPALPANGEQGLHLTIQDYISSDIRLVPITDSQVTVDGDIKVTLKKNTTSNVGRISFDVDRISTKPSKITIKGVEIKIDRSVPYGVYDLVVSGQSVFANKASVAKEQINGLFDVYGYAVPYINVATEGSNSPLKSNVKIAKDSDIVIVDGVQQQMAYPTYFDTTQSSFLVPARFISHIFGVEENNIFWNDTTKTVSIITANRTIQFTANSNIMTVGANGAPSNVTMTAKAILHPVTERLYVPFRAIGDAFGVPVSYDEATQMGEYNAVVVK